MKKMMLMALLMLVPMYMAAQQPQGGREGGHPRFNPQEFQQRMQQELTREAGFTTEEAQAFFPLYQEMREKQREKGDQIRDLKRSTTGDAKAYASAVTRVKQLQVEMAEIEQAYYKRILKVVPAEKVFRAMKAEDAFHRRMVQGQHGPRKDKERTGAGAPRHHRAPHENPQ